MKYLIIDKKQRIELSTDSTYAQSRVEEELKAIEAEYLFATTDDITIDLNNPIKISVLGQPLEDFSHIILRGHRLHKPWEYETKKFIADYIDQHNRNNPNKRILLQNQVAIQNLPYYDKLWVQKMCIENELQTIPTLYRTSGEYRESIPTPFIIKDFTGENDLRMIDGKEKVKKNVYLIQDENELDQENLVNKDKTKYFVQKFIPTGEDIRVYVSNGLAIGAWKRKATEGFMTVKAGEYSLIDLNEDKELKEFSEKVASVFKADFIAIDIMRDENGKLMLLEISFNPGFKAYETKIEGEKANIAKAIIQSFGK